MTKTILNFDNFDRQKHSFYEEFKDNYTVIELFREKEPEQVIQRHKSDVSGIICCPGKGKITRSFMEAFPNLEIIVTESVGYDHIDTDAAKARGITVCNTPDLVTNDTADTALALMLNVSRRFVEADAYVRIGKWEQGGFGLGHRLGGKTVGIVGLGRIGQAIAKRAEAFECTVKYTGRGAKEGHPYEFIDGLNKLAEESDFLVISCAATEETKGMIDLGVLKSLGPEGYLINVSRGSVVNEDELQIALANKYIAGAGLDVYRDEPRVPEGLKVLDNVVLLPHIGTATVETRTEMAKLVIANIMSWFEKGETLTRVV